MMLSNHYVSCTATSPVLHGSSFLLEILGPILYQYHYIDSIELTLAPGLHRGRPVYHWTCCLIRWESHPFLQSSA